MQTATHYGVEYGVILAELKSGRLLGHKTSRAKGWLIHPDDAAVWYARFLKCQQLAQTDSFDRLKHWPKPADYLMVIGKTVRNNVHVRMGVVTAVITRMAGENLQATLEVTDDHGNVFHVNTADTIHIY